MCHAIGEKGSVFIVERVVFFSSNKDLRLKINGKTFNKAVGEKSCDKGKSCDKPLGIVYIVCLMLKYKLNHRLGRL